VIDPRLQPVAFFFPISTTFSRITSGGSAQIGHIVPVH
jgi:hypothetical protein